MTNSEIKAAVRTFYREKLYALINLSGLALAIACSLVLGLYLKSELTYDRHHLRHREIFRVVNEFDESGSAKTFAETSHALGPLLKQNYPEVKDYVRFVLAANSHNEILIRSDDKDLYWTDIYYVTANVFDVFTHKIIFGDPKTALKDNSSAAVSETFAKRYFGNVNPIGKTIRIDEFQEIPRKITLVFRDLPENTHLKYDVLLNEMSSPRLARAISTQQLFGIEDFTYLVMPENYNVRNFKTISDSFFARFMGQRARTLKSSWRCWLQPLVDIHLYSDVGYDLPTGNRYYIYGFSTVAVFILLVACINYVNLAIARAARRSKEIGMRKILGVPKITLISRFLGEAVLFSLIATVFGIAIVEIVLKLAPISGLLGKPLAFTLAEEPLVFLAATGLSLLVGILSGLYPAIYLSSIPPLSALTGGFGKRRGLFQLREMLVLTQFTVSVIVIACTLIMAMQMRYISKKPLGFQKENRVIVTLYGDGAGKYQLIKNELLKNSSILGVTSSTWKLGDFISTNVAQVESEAGAMVPFGMNWNQVEDNYLEVMNMQMASGRDFSKKLLTDIGSNFVVNEALVKSMGWKDPIGKRIDFGNTRGKVIGVIKDFHFRSLHSKVDPIALFLITQPGLRLTVTVNISETNVPLTLKFLQDKFAELTPRYPFKYVFLDDSLHKLYLSEERLMKMTGIFSGICIFISCLGLFGLASFTTEQRSKEIGIRKVLGATASQIVMMLAQKTLWLVIAGSIVASIVAYYAIDEWLTHFAYRIGIHPWVFVISSVLVIVVAYITIAIQSFKTAQSNPSIMLRYE
jgi:putative ABC transport system permease protein